MDLSDGLAADLPRFLPQGLGACVEQALLPLPKVERYHHRAIEWALRGGEDYVLLAAVAPGAEVPGLIPIGVVDTGAIRVRDLYGFERPLGLGFDQLRARDG